MPTDAARSVPVRQLGRLVRLELFKLRRRPMPRILLAIQVGLTVGLSALIYAVYRFGGAENAATLDSAGGDTVVDRIVFPGVMTGAVEFGLTFGLPLVIILAASTVGGEFAWGTVRLILGRGVGRGPYVLAKLVAVALWWPLALVIGSLGGVALATLLAVVDGQPGLGAVTGGDLRLLIARFGTAWLAGLVYAGMTALLAMQFRSTAVGIAAGLTAYFGEQFVVDVAVGQGVPVLESLTRFGVSYNVQTLIGGGRDSDNSVLLALAILVFFLVSSAYGTIRHLRRHDVVVAGVG